MLENSLMGFFNFGISDFPTVPGEDATVEQLIAFKTKLSKFERNMFDLQHDYPLRSKGRIKIDSNIERSGQMQDEINDRILEIYDAQTSASNKLRLRIT